MAQTPPPQYSVMMTGLATCLFLLNFYTNSNLSRKKMNALHPIGLKSSLGPMAKLLVSMVFLLQIASTYHALKLLLLSAIVTLIFAKEPQQSKTQETFENFILRKNAALSLKIRRLSDTHRMLCEIRVILAHLRRDCVEMLHILMADLPGTPKSSPPEIPCCFDFNVQLQPVLRGTCEMTCQTRRLSF